jgi:hypothetical protein
MAFEYLVVPIVIIISCLKIYYKFQSNFYRNDLFDSLNSFLMLKFLGIQLNQVLILPISTHF